MVLVIKVNEKMFINTKIRSIITLNVRGVNCIKCIPQIFSSYVGDEILKNDINTFQQQYEIKV